MNNWVYDNMGWIILACLIALISLLIVLSVKEGREWEEFSKQHNCKIISKERPHNSVGVGYKGSPVLLTTPGKTGYLCDDGITYFR